MKVLRLNVAVLGDSSSGKTTLCHILSNKPTPTTYSPTVRPGIHRTRIPIPSDPVCAIELFLIDVSGADCLRGLVTELVADAHAAFFVCDVSCADGPAALDTWSTLFFDATMRDDAPCLVFATHNTDTVGLDNARAFAEHLGTWVVDGAPAAGVSEWAEGVWRVMGAQATDELDL